MVKIWTVNGEVDLHNIHDSELSAEALAPVLSKINRFSGRTPVPWSVAAHSVLVSKFCETPQARLWALLHDAHEAFIGDITTPAVQFIANVGLNSKKLEGDIEYVKHQLDRQIAKLWMIDLGSSEWSLVRALDKTVLSIEAMSFFGVDTGDVECDILDRGMEYMAAMTETCGVLSACDAEALYLKELKEAAKAAGCTPPMPAIMSAEA